VVLVLNDGVFDIEGYDWDTVLRTRLPATNAKLKAEGIRLIVVYHPMAWDYLGPEFYRLDAGVGGGEAILHYGISYDRVVRDVKQARVPLIDLWPAFLAWQLAPDRQPLFGTDDKHLTVAGREMMGRAVAEDLASFVK
jgi:hypothetical protein